MSKKNEVVVVAADIDGMSKIEALVFLGSKGFDAKTAGEFYKENKPAPIPSFKARFYAELELGPMDEVRFNEIIASESVNVIAHKSAHKAVYELVQKIWG